MLAVPGCSDPGGGSFEHQHKASPLEFQSPIADSRWVGTTVEARPRHLAGHDSGDGNSGIRSAGEEMEKSPAALGAGGDPACYNRDTPRGGSVPSSTQRGNIG
jgi:hypothetical protein